jgi:hypothetical protein
MPPYVPATVNLVQKNSLQVRKGERLHEHLQVIFAIEHSVILSLELLTYAQVPHLQTTYIDSSPSPNDGQARKRPHAHNDEKAVVHSQ